MADLPRIWNERMTSYLGCTPKDDAQGVLQASSALRSPSLRTFLGFPHPSARTPGDLVLHMATACAMQD